MKLKKIILVLLTLAAACFYIKANETFNKDTKTGQTINLQNLSFGNERTNERNELFEYLQNSGVYFNLGYNSLMLISKGTPYSAINAIYANNSFYLAVYNFLLFGPVIICLPLIFTGVPFIIFSYINSNYLKNKKSIIPFFNYNQKSNSSLIGIKINFNNKKEQI